MLKLPLNAKKAKYTAEELADLSIDEVKKMIVSQDPKAFDKKASKKKPAKRTASKRK